MWLSLTDDEYARNNMYFILVKELDDEVWMMWREPVNMKHETQNMKYYKDVYSIQWTGLRNAQCYTVYCTDVRTNYS